MSERKRLVRTVGDLLGIIEEMHNTYQNDVATNRAERMAQLSANGRAMAQPVLNNYPPGYGRSK